MDENKDFSTSEIEAENTVNSDTDTVINDTTEDLTAETSADVNNYDGTETDFAASVQAYLPAKKKNIIQLPIIIAIGCVVLLALGFLVFKCFFNTSVVGTWAVDTTATGDEATTASTAATDDEANINYYTFEDDGTASITLGTMKMVGTYTLAESDGKQTITMAISSLLNSTFEYEVSGNAFTGRTLTLTVADYNTSFTLKSQSIEKPALTPDKDFKPSDKLTGEWKDKKDYNDGTTYNMSYNFKDDGTVLINEANELYVEGTYTYTDSTVTVTYYASTKATMDIVYNFDGDVLVINGLGYSKGGSSSGDESSK